jgi:hypothetical protein
MEGWHVRGGGYLVSSTAEGEAGEDLDGTAGGGRFEIAKALDKKDTVEVGFRASVGARDGGELSGTVSGFSVQADVTSTDIFIEPVVRGYLDLSDKFRPFVEVFVGAAIMDIEVDGTVSGLGSATISDNGSGITYGAGLGFEWSPSPTYSIALGGELRSTNLDTDDLGDFDVLDIGGAIMIGHRF